MVLKHFGATWETLRTFLEHFGVLQCETSSFSECFLHIGVSKVLPKRGRNASLKEKCHNMSQTFKGETVWTFRPEIRQPCESVSTVKDCKERGSTRVKGLIFGAFAHRSSQLG